MVGKKEKDGQEWLERRRRMGGNGCEKGGGLGIEKYRMVDEKSGAENHTFLTATVFTPLLWLSYLFQSLSTKDTIFPSTFTLSEHIKCLF